MWKKILIIVLVFVLVLIGWSVYDLSRFQVGYEQPAVDVVAEANRAVVMAETAVSAITTYDQIAVSVTDDISVVVYARESETAVANVLMIHGAAGGAWVWEYYFDAFPDEFNLYAMSWRGHFDSTPVPDANSADYVVDQTAVFNAITERNDLPIHLIGHSFGGATTVLQAAEMPEQIASMHLLAAVVPLEFSWLQAQIVPRFLPNLIIQQIEEDPQAASPFADMFIADQRMTVYKERHADQPYSQEKFGLMPGNAFSLDWQDELAEAYAGVGEADFSIWWIVARYDNVVKVNAQLEIAEQIGAKSIVLDSGHYIQLDALAPESAHIIVDQLRTITP